MQKETQNTIRTTGKFDCDNREIFEGDKVVRCWGCFLGGGRKKATMHYEIHTIKVKDAFLMANGKMHDDGGGKIFCLGEAYNFWKGSEVQKLTDEEVKNIGIEDDTRFFFDDNKKAVKVTY